MDSNVVDINAKRKWMPVRGAKVLLSIESSRTIQAQIYKELLHIINNQGFLVVESFDKDNRFAHIQGTPFNIHVDRLIPYPESITKSLNNTQISSPFTQPQVNDKQWWMDLHKDLTLRMHEITKAKNSDYTGDSDDPFFNFKMGETLRFGTVEQGFLFRISDKFSRIISLTTKDAQVKDESIEDTLLDLANYCLLFLGALKQKARKNN